MPADTQCGVFAIIGAPNAGKSTLLNRMVGSKVAIVTPKVQTTRNRIRGICMQGSAQMVFVDTPGIFDAKKRFEQAMVQSAWAGMDDADETILLIDSQRNVDEDTQRILDMLVKRQKKVILVLNKIDLIAKHELLALVKLFQLSGAISEVFMISAVKGDGVEDLKRFLAKIAKPGPWLYPEDQLTDMSERLLAAEVTREKLFLKLRQELPYSLHVETESWEEKKDGSVKINQIIFVERENQKKIVLGKGGDMLKSIGTGARLELEKIFARKIHLFLHLKVREGWKDKAEVYQLLGLE